MHPQERRPKQETTPYMEISMFPTPKQEQTYDKSVSYVT